MEALLRTMWQSFVDWTEGKGGEFDKKKLEDKLQVCKDALKNTKEIPENVESLKSERLLERSPVPSLISLHSSTNALVWLCYFFSSSKQREKVTGRYISQQLLRLFPSFSPWIDGTTQSGFQSILPI